MAASAPPIPKLDLSQPRYAAALKVTGIDPEDLEPPKLEKLEKEGLSDVVRKELAKQAQHVFERKRLQLVAQLEDTAQALADADVDAILAPAPSQRLPDGFIERARLQQENHRRKFKEGIEKEINSGLEKKKFVEAKAKAEEERLQRVRQARAEQTQAFEARQKERDKKFEKKTEKAQAMNLEKRKEAQELAQKLRDASERVANKKEEEKQRWREKGEERSRQMAEIASRHLEIRRTEFEDNSERLENWQRREQVLEEHFANQNAAHWSRFEDRNEKVTKKLETAHSQREERETAREASFLAGVDRLSQANQAMATTLQERASNLTSSFEKRKEKWKKNVQSEREELKGRIKTLKAKDQERSAAVEAKVHLQKTEAEQRVAGSREIMNIMVEKEKSRMARSEACAQEQALLRIQMTKARVNGILQDKEYTLQMRRQLVDESMLEKEKMQHVKDTVRVGSPRQVNRLLQEMGLATGEVKEGEEGQQQ